MICLNIKKHYRVGFVIYNLYQISLLKFAIFYSFFFENRIY